MLPRPLEPGEPRPSSAIKPTATPVTSQLDHAAPTRPSPGASTSMVITFVVKNYAQQVKGEAGRGLSGRFCPDVVEPSSGTGGRRGDKHTLGFQLLEMRAHVGRGGIDSLV